MSANPAGNGSPDNPHSLPITTPTFGGSDNWTLQAIVQLQSSVAAMNANLTTLSDRVKDMNSAQEKTAEKLVSIEKKIYAATAIITLMIGVGGFFANKAIDFGLDMAKRQDQPPTVTSAPAIQTLPPAAPPTAK